MKRDMLGLPVAAVLALIVGAAGSATPLDGATVVNSGSTNAPGYIIRLRSDGTGTVQPRRFPQNAMPRRLTVPAGLAQKLLADAKAAKAAAPPAQSCMKSASFGFSLTVTYHGWNSPDLACPGGDELAALRTDVQALEQTAGLNGPPHIIRLPNEPRRLPSDVTSPSPTPTATTRPSPRAK